MKDECILRTTINVEEQMLTNLKSLCKEKGVSVTYVIKKSIKLYLDEMRKDEFKWHTLTYQKDGPVYKKFHIKLKAYEYDSYSDAKKVTRLSFSYIVAIAIKRFGDIILEGDVMDSYPLNAYTKYCIVDDNCTYYVFSWGISRNEVQITLPPVVEIDPEE
jgi:predicted DNA-binding protein